MNYSTFVVFQYKMLVLAIGVIFLAFFTVGAHANATKLADAPNVAIVKAHCTACHSESLITQNRMTRQGWLDTIRWMQASQGLWPLGQHETVILDYLEKYYHPEASGRRKPLAAEPMPPKRSANPT